MMIYQKRIRKDMRMTLLRTDIFRTLFLLLN